MKTEIKTYPQAEVSVGSKCPQCQQVVMADVEHKCPVPVVHEVTIDDSFGVTEKL